MAYIKISVDEGYEINVEYPYGDCVKFHEFIEQVEVLAVALYSQEQWDQYFGENG